MDYDEVLRQVLDLLQREKRLSYRVLKRRCGLDDDDLEDVKEDLIYAKKLAVDEDGRVLVWTGAPEMMSASTSSTGRALERAPLTYVPPHLTEKILASRATLAGERKQVTVLFADIKDSTELINDLDPEAAQQLLDQAVRRMMEAVHRYEGTVNQLRGDGIMALFGAPIAHEDHAMRTCYAAVAMQAAMREYTEELRRTHGLEVHIRVGLNSGEVVVRAIRNDLHMDYSAMGQTTHLAARMEQLATPGSIRLTAATLNLVDGLVRVNALGQVPVKGLAQPVEVFELIGVSPIRRRLQAAAVRGLTRFVGREREMDALGQALQRAGTGHGQVVAVVGEAGMGKSRLVYECVHSHRTKGWLVLESASESYGKATPYLPVIDLLKRYTHVEERDDARSIRAKVTGQVLTLDESLQDVIPALLSLLGALPEDSPFQKLDPPQRRQRTLEALKRLLLRESQVQPLLLLFEDLHWIDAESQALLDHLVESLPTASLLLLVNYRPEYQHEWGDKTSYRQLRLDPLPPTSTEAFLQVLLGDDQSFAPLKRLLIARTGGNPFFLEETVRTLVELGVLVGERGAYRLAQPVDSLQVPATVQAVLAARIDRLAPEDKHLLQCAAVIGMEVPLSLLQAIAELPDGALQRGLAHLQAAEFLYETRLFPDHEYTFKHALTHEVAYGGLLQERRRASHAHIVAALEALSGERVAEQVERLAHHALRGEVWNKALLYFRQAGEKALARSAHREAVVYFEQALNALQHLPEQYDTRVQAIDLRLALRSALFPSSDAERILASLREAEALALAIDDHHRLGQISGFLSAHFRNQGAYEQAIAAAQRALALATGDEDEVLQALANLFLGAAHSAQGDYPRAIACLAESAAFLGGARRREHFGQAILPAVQTCAFLSAAYAELGMFAEGWRSAEEGLHIAETVAHPGSLMWADYGIGLLALRQGDLPRALPRLEQAMGICQEAELPIFAPRMAAALAAGYALDGRAADAVAVLTRAREHTDTAAMSGFLALYHLTWGEVHRRAGRLEEAHTLAEQALVRAREHRERAHQAYALCLLGDMAASCHLPSAEEAEAHYRPALALAEELGMRPLMAHCHHGLGTLYSKIDQRQQARAELSSAVELYSAMAMHFWLPQAEATLARIA